MFAGLDGTATCVFVAFFALVTIIGFYSARWRRGDLTQLEEWGLAGRRFGTIVTWFLVGGDFYTAYTMIAVPALVYGVGANGFFALPFTIIVYPFVFFVMPRLWRVSRRRNYLTLADFTRGRYGSHWLALAIAITGILATVPYIALQLIGIQVSIAALGFHGSSWANNLPLVGAFVILAAYDYTSGLRAGASIALVKGVMIYIVVLAAVTWIPFHIGGYHHIFQQAGRVLAARPTPGTLILPREQYLSFATLALGSALAAFLYPHTATSILSASSGNVVKRNAVLLPAFTFLLGLIALLGYVALAAGIQVRSTNDVVPTLFQRVFPSWFAGFCFAGIAIGALVPAVVMSIASANLFTRNIYREYFRTQLTPREESNMAKLVSLIIKFGALAFVLFGTTIYAINLQLLGGIWILQTLPSVVFGLFTRWFHPTALLAGWILGMISGTAMVWSQGLKSAVYPLHIGGTSLAAYAAIHALVLNLVIATVLTPVLQALGAHPGSDETLPEDYQEA
jgi:SSS family solute:Na+ symporter